MIRLLKSYKRIIIGSRFVLYTNLTDRIFSFIIFVFLARKYSSDIFGQLIIIFTLSTLFINLFDLGLGNYLHREIANSKNNAQEIFSKIFSVTVYLFPVYFISLFICFKILYPDISIMLFVIIALIMYESTFINLCNRALSGLSDYKNQFTAYWISRGVIIIIFIPLVFMFDINLQILMLVMLTGFLINIFFVTESLSKHDIHLKGLYRSFNHVLPLIKITYPLGLAVIFNYLYDKLDLLLISKFLNYNEVAYYNIGYGLFKTASLSFSFIIFTSFTQVSFLSRNIRAVKLFLKKYTPVIFIICITITVLLYFFAEQIITLFYTEKYNDSILVLKILSFALIAVGLNNLCGVTLNAMKKYKSLMVITVLAVVLNVIINIYVIPIYGIKGASYVSVLTEYFILVLEALVLFNLLRRIKTI